MVFRLFFLAEGIKKIITTCLEKTKNTLYICRPLMQIAFSIFTSEFMPRS